jgi:glycosyltransferase involved in cell wall biosynthesis
MKNNLNIEINQKKGLLVSRKSYKKELEKQLKNITNSRFYNLWQSYCNFRKKNTQPKLLIQIIKNKIPFNVKLNIKKILSLFNFNEKKLEKYKKFLIESKGENENFKEITEKVSIIIPTKNAGPFFNLVLKKINCQKYIKNIELIIMDSGSTDDTVKIAKKNHAKIIKVNPKDFSHSSTRNIGAKLATGKYIVFTVQDAFFLNDTTLYDLIDLLEKTGAVAGSARQIPRSDADIFASWQINELTKIFSPNKNNVLIDINHKDFSNLLFDNKRAYCTIDDVCSIFKRKTFLEIKGFDESFRYGEDLEIGKRLIDKNKKLIYLCSNGVVHSHNRPASYFIKTYYLGTILQDKVYKKNKINSNLNPNIFVLLKNIIKLGKDIKKKYSNNHSDKIITFASTNYISDILKSIKNSATNNKSTTNDLRSEFDIFLKDRIAAINTFVNFNNLPIKEKLILIDKIFSMFIGNKLAFFYINTEKKNSNLIQINKILESGV